MPVIPEPERSKIYTRIKHQLGAPLRSVELEDEMLDSLMELSIQDYEQYTLDWLIESSWVNLVNLNMSEKSVAQALITRTMNLEDQYSYSYSKIVGLQTKGPWVLKKDYFILEKNVQTYEIPAGREVTNYYGIQTHHFKIWLCGVLRIMDLVVWDWVLTKRVMLSLVTQVHTLC